MVGSAQTGTGKPQPLPCPPSKDWNNLGMPPWRRLVNWPSRSKTSYLVSIWHEHGPSLRGVAWQTTRAVRKPDIVVAPGRLLDHLGQGNLNLKKIEVLILDEVDRMLDMEPSRMSQNQSKKPPFRKLFVFGHNSRFRGTIGGWAGQPCRSQNRHQDFRCRHGQSCSLPRP